MKQKRIAQPSDSPPAVMPTYGPASDIDTGHFQVLL